MLKKLSSKGFGAVELLVAIVVIAVLGLGGWYVWHTHQTKKTTDTTKTQTSTTNKTNTAADDTANYVFPVEKMSIAYGKMWTITNKSQTPNSCGNSDMLTMKDNNLNLNFDFGSICGKGSAQCFGEPNSGCITESKNIATVQLSSTSKAYVLVYRSTIDNGATWNYAVGLTSDSVCTADFCTYTPLNIGAGAGGSTISGGYSLGTKNATSLDEFAALPEVQDATDVLKTAHY